MIVEDVMTVNPKFVYTNDGAERVLELMTKGGVGGLPVLNLEERVVGMIARRDVIRAALND
jgi:CBS domain-containing protein